MAKKRLSMSINLCDTDDGIMRICAVMGKVILLFENTLCIVLNFLGKAHRQIFRKYSLTPTTVLSVIIL